MARPERRPETFAACLREVADYLDAADDLVRVVSRDTNRPLSPGNEMQTDLRAVAEWLEAHVDANAVMTASLPSIPRVAHTEGEWPSRKKAT